MNLDDLKRMVKDHQVEYIDLKFCDLPGFWHHITLPVGSLTPELFTNGVGMDGSSLPGFSSIERGDMILRPDENTAFLDPFFEKPTVSMIGDIMEVGDRIVPYSRNPRRVSKDAESHLTGVIPGASMVIGPEFEFYVFDRVSFSQGADFAFYRIESAEARLTTDEDEEALGYKIPYKGGYHAAPPMDRHHNLRSQITSMLKAVGIELKYHHHEVGGSSQHEIEVAFFPMSLMADRTMLAKYIIKNQCYRWGKSATFMPKPLFNEPGSGLHVHQYLADENGSLFYDEKGPARLSEHGLHFIGGLLAHVDSVLAFTNPSTNSYKRLVPGFEAPVARTYSVANRTACIRIPGYQRDPRHMRFEFRPSDGTMNPYLAFAAMLMAGLDGIKNRIDPGLPLDRNLDRMTPDELTDLSVHQLPSSLTKALDALEKDHAYLLESGVFTEDLLEHWLKLKRKDVTNIRIRPTPFEFEAYYDL